MKNLLINGSAEPFRQIVAGSADAVVGIDASHRLVIFNAAAEKMFGYTVEDAIGQHISMLIPEEFRAGHSAHVNNFQAGHENSRFMAERKSYLSALRADGTVFPAAATILSLKTDGGPLMVAHLRDISVRLALVEEQTRLASLDPLTNALNRRAFFEKAEAFFNSETKKSHGFAILLMDLDHFKTVNDQHGHAAGDEILRGFSDVCRSVLREDDIFARWGGEEFVAMLPVANIDAGMEIAERIRCKTEEHIFKILGHNTWRQTVSVGVVHSTGNRGTLTLQIGKADKALYLAKAAGRNCIQKHGAKMVALPKRSA